MKVKLHEMEQQENLIKYDIHKTRASMDNIGDHEKNLHS